MIVSETQRGLHGDANEGARALTEQVDHDISIVNARPASSSISFATPCVGALHRKHRCGGRWAAMPAASPEPDGMRQSATWRSRT
jgi:hypothetical protein